MTVPDVWSTLRTRWVEVLDKHTSGPTASEVVADRLFTALHAVFPNLERALAAWEMIETESLDHAGPADHDDDEQLILDCEECVRIAIFERLRAVQGEAEPQP